jgi:pimeloyl-ACP methyl ester carboxylesterase
MLTKRDLTLADGRTLLVYDSGPVTDRAELPVFWHHGTSQLGTPPAPLGELADELGIRWLSFDRPSYGGSSQQPGRDVAAAAADVAAVADRLGIERFAALGTSGGGPSALACAALLPERTVAVACLAGLAPFEPAGLDWFAGMAADGEQELRLAAVGRPALERHFETAQFDPDTMFTPSDRAVLETEWVWLGSNGDDGIDGIIDDDLAYVKPWGFQLAQVQAPVLLLHGEDDRIVPSAHSVWLARQLPRAQLSLLPGEGHVSILAHGRTALEWLRLTADRSTPGR